jgi:hypothetical protein
MQIVKNSFCSFIFNDEPIDLFDFASEMGKLNDEAKPGVKVLASRPLQAVVSDIIIGTKVFGAHCEEGRIEELTAALLKLPPVDVGQFRLFIENME